MYMGWRTTATAKHYKRLADTAGVLGLFEDMTSELSSLHSPSEMNLSHQGNFPGITA
jgi:hypothetical protein